MTYNISENRAEAPWLQRQICQALGLNKGMGSGSYPNPRINQYRGHRDSYPLAKASHWGNLRRQDAESLKTQVRRPTGSPKDRKLQDHNFICDTRLKHAALQYMAHDADTTYNVIDNISDDGYDFYVASYVGEEDRDLVLGMFGEEVAGWFEQILIPGGTYLVCEGDRCQYPANYADDLYRETVTNLLSSSGYELDRGPEVEILHWFYKEGDEKLNSSRYLELWLPIVKK